MLFVVHKKQEDAPFNVDDPAEDVLPDGNNENPPVESIEFPDPDPSIYPKARYEPAFKKFAAPALYIDPLATHPSPSNESHESHSFSLFPKRPIRLH